MSKCQAPKRRNSCYDGRLVNLNRYRRLPMGFDDDQYQYGSDRPRHRAVRRPLRLLPAFRATAATTRLAGPAPIRGCSRSESTSADSTSSRSHPPTRRDARSVCRRPARLPWLWRPTLAGLAVAAFVAHRAATVPTRRVVRRTEVVSLGRPQPLPNCPVSRWYL